MSLVLWGGEGAGGGVLNAEVRCTTGLQLNALLVVTFKITFPLVVLFLSDNSSCICWL